MPQKILLYGFTIEKTARSYPHALEKNLSNLPMDTSLGGLFATITASPRHHLPVEVTSSNCSSPLIEIVLISLAPKFTAFRSTIRIRLLSKVRK